MYVRHPRLPFALALCALVLLGGLVYAPGLHGPFLFDDYANLPALGADGPITNAAAFWRYLTSGQADPIGRPLALLSFLIDAHDWPASPWPFKRTNLVIHLLNGVLLALLLRRLGRTLANDRRLATPQATWRIDVAAWLGAACWLLHPLLVSTTLYIVQREAMLPATFTLLGLMLWLRGRDHLLRGHVARGLWWMLAGLGGCTALAMLAKANGILLPALVLVIEYTVLRSRRPDIHGQPATPAPTTSEADTPGLSTYRRALWVLAWLPAAVVAAYLLNAGWSGLVHGISSTRPWTLGQRLLTEPRVLMDYLTLLWLPRPFTPGLFNDHIQASASLLSPATTLPALLAVIALIAGAWLLRKRHPALAMAVLFYFVGQSLESSTIALELYFEHRNYLPALMMFWPLALWLSGVGAPANDAGPAPTADPWAKARLALSAIVVAGLALMTLARADLWGNARDQALLWARLNPTSPRAQATAAQAEMATGHPKRAVRRLSPMLASDPDQVQIVLNLFGAECQMGRVTTDTLAASRRSLRTTRDPGSLLTHWFGRAIAQASHPPCPQLNLDTVESLVDAALANPFLRQHAGRRQDLYDLKGRIALARGQADLALADFNRALDQQVDTGTALAQAAMLGSAGFPRLGLAHLDHYDAESRHHETRKLGMPAIHAWVLRRQHYWQDELRYLRATLRADADHRSTHSQ